MMPARFHAEPIIQATELLLQERAPRDVDAAHSRREAVKTAYVRELVPPTPRRFFSPHQPIPHTQLLSNGRYAVMMTAAGSGYSRWGDLAVTRWREDATRDDWGTYVFLRDVRQRRGVVGGVPTHGSNPIATKSTFFEDRVEIIRRDGSLTTTLEVAISPEDDAEVRRVTIANGGSRTREIELTSYAEIVLAPDAADAAHPAFSKLFVHTDTGRQPRERAQASVRTPRNSARTFIDDSGAILATRRRRSPDEPEVWAAHLAVVEGELVGALEFETDRARFLGRGRSIRTPVSVVDGRPLSNTSGAVLDPIFSLRRRIRLAPGTTAHVTFWTLVAASRARGARPGRQAPRPGRLRARRHPGMDAGAGASCSISASTPTKRACSSASPPTCSTPTRRCGPPPTRSRAASAGRRSSGPTAFPATCRSSSAGSTTSSTWRSSASCCAPMNTGG